MFVVTVSKYDDQHQLWCLLPPVEDDVLKSRDPESGLTPCRRRPASPVPFSIWWGSPPGPLALGPWTKPPGVWKVPGTQHSEFPAPSVLLNSLALPSEPEHPTANPRTTSAATHHHLRAFQLACR